MEAFAKYRFIYLLATVILGFVVLVGNYFEAEMVSNVAGKLTLLWLAVYALSGSFRGNRKDEDGGDILMNRAMFLAAITFPAIYLFLYFFC